MKFVFKLILPLTAAFSVLISNVQAVYIDEFPSSGSTVRASIGAFGFDEFGYFGYSSRGDSIEETFIGTGLSSVEQLDLNFDITRNGLGLLSHTEWDVLVNGITVGSWFWSERYGTGTVSESYSFASIVGNGDYTIRMEVTSELPLYGGGIAIGHPGSMTLHGVSVPDSSSTLALFVLGFAALIGLRHRFQ